MIQIEYGYSDEETVLQIQENPYLQFLNKYIDHMILKSEATSEDIRKLCSEAADHQFATLC